jgi:biopolymer transport protein ExbD
MSYDNPQRGCAGNVVAIVAVLFVVLLGGLVLLGLGALVWTGTHVRQRVEVARAEAERGVAEVARAEHLAAQAQAEDPATVEMPQAPARDVVIRIGQDGAISVNDRRMDLDGLKAWIQEVGENGHERLAVQLKAAPNCLVKHVVAVQSVCHELGVERVSLSTMESRSSAEDEPVPNSETTELR